MNRETQTHRHTQLQHRKLCSTKAQLRATPQTRDIVKRLRKKGQQMKRSDTSDHNRDEAAERGKDNVEVFMSRTGKNEQDQ